jgi:hypothetical protein
MVAGAGHLLQRLISAGLVGLSLTAAARKGRAA